MLLTLQHADVEASSAKKSGLVLGGGGTARAAIYALHQLGISPIYLLGRSPDKMVTLADSFPAEFDLKVIRSPSDANGRNPAPTVAIGTIPGDQAIDEKFKSAIRTVLTKGAASGDSLLLEMAYKPADTPIKLLAEEVGWKTVNGLEVLVAQGVYQFEHWTGIVPHYETARVSFLRFQAPNVS